MLTCDMLANRMDDICGERQSQHTPLPLLNAGNRDTYLRRLLLLLLLHFGASMHVACGHVADV